MKKELKITEVHTDFSDYFEQKAISDKGQTKLDEIDILAVPTEYENRSYYFAQETIDFIKYCRGTTSEHSFDVLADGDIQIRSLHSFDIWMPVIWVATNIMLPFAINMVSNYIWEKMKGREDEPAQVDVTFITRCGDKEKQIHYSGDAKTFKESFEKIDLNNW